MGSLELSTLLFKLQGIQKQLGGPLADLESKKGGDEFNKVKLTITDIFNFISKKQDERDKLQAKNGRAIAVVKADAEIREKMNEAKIQLGQMEDILKRQRKNKKKYPPAQVEIKEKQLANCQKMLKNISVREEGGVVADQEQLQTLTDMKLALHGSRLETDPASERPLNQSEIETLTRFAEKDKELDNLLTQINGGLDVLHKKAEAIGDQLDHQEIILEDLDKEVAKTHTAMVNANGRLKKVLLEFKGPCNFWMDIVCLLVLFGLIGIIVKLSINI